MSGTSSAAASIESPKHKEIVIRYKGSKAVPEVWRKLRPSELVQKLNEALASTEDTLIMAAKFKAARINSRGSIVAHKETAAQGETLRRHKEDWKGFVATEADVMLPVYLVIVYGIPIKSVDPGNKTADGQKDGSLVVDCKTPEGANVLIKGGTLVWSHGLRVVRRHDPTCQLIRCLKCYQYGKCKGTFCTNKKTCGKCASVEHNTEDCTSSVPRCCLCHGAHYAWSKQCPKYKDEIRRVEVAKAELNARPFYPEPCYEVSPGPSVVGSRPAESQNDKMETDHIPTQANQKGTSWTGVPTASQNAPRSRATEDLEEYILVKARKSKTANQPLREISTNPRKR
ncbi:uncharacterized protein PV09_08428 [Verruconis gallopava]|uniref:CCHC-type domain-containing protein n=1 Tax=Verruconis gallopava TaxID=253628 RepID=A0A0D2ALE8_9PEZI|nr:uncharacterized protein PV09_08428 [Verruconis gallopava]KIV99898.1 hypothetical protein PV09_08428 [Verruconis gallopava]